MSLVFDLIYDENCSVLVVRIRHVVFMNRCRLDRAALALLWPLCWLWFTGKCNCWVLRWRLFSQVIFQSEPQTSALSQHTGIIRDTTLSGCSAADCCAVPGYASFYIIHREKSVSWTCLICLLFSTATLPIHQTALSLAEHQSAVPSQECALCLPSCYLIYF